MLFYVVKNDLKALEEWLDDHSWVDHHFFVVLSIEFQMIKWLVVKAEVPPQIRLHQSRNCKNNPDVYFQKVGPPASY